MLAGRLTSNSEYSLINCGVNSFNSGGFKDKLEAAAAAQDLPIANAIHLSCTWGKNGRRYACMCVHVDNPTVSHYVSMFVLTHSSTAFATYPTSSHSIHTIHPLPTILSPWTKIQSEACEEQRLGTNVTEHKQKHKLRTNESNIKLLA